MNARPAVSKTHPQKTFPPFKNRRVAARERMSCRVTYTYQAGGATYAVDGVGRDFCKIGCGIRGSIIPPVGSKTRLTIYLRGQKVPLPLDARVTWVAGDYFGVQFSQMNKRDYTRIRQYMWMVLNG